METIELAMAKLEECELSKLRHYAKEADRYPACWLNLLDNKQECVDTFAKETVACDHYWTETAAYYYSPEGTAEGGANYFKRQNIY
jgi:hypothetical protein